MGTSLEIKAEQDFQPLLKSRSKHPHNILPWSRKYILISTFVQPLSTRCLLNPRAFSPEHGTKLCEMVTSWLLILYNM